MKEEISRGIICGFFFMKTCTSDITEINLHSISYCCFLTTEFYAYIFKELNILAYEYGEDF